MADESFCLCWNWKAIETDFFEGGKKVCRQRPDEGELNAQRSGFPFGGPKQLVGGHVESRTAIEGDAHRHAGRERVNQRGFELNRAADVNCAFKAEVNRFVASFVNDSKLDFLVWTQSTKCERTLGG